MYVDLSSRRILVVGAGAIAARRLGVLARFCGHITVVAPSADERVEKLADKGLLELLPRKFEAKDIEGFDIVIAATNDRALNDEIYRLCKASGIPVNVSSDKSKCDFHFPSIVKKDGIVIGINASGEDHSGVKEARMRIERAMGGESMYE